MSNALDRCRDALVETVGHGGDSFIATVVPDDLALLIALADASIECERKAAGGDGERDSIESWMARIRGVEARRLAALAALTQEDP